MTSILIDAAALCGGRIVFIRQMAPSADTVPVTTALWLTDWCHYFRPMVSDPTLLYRLRDGVVLVRSPIDRAARTLLQQRGYGDRIDVIAADMFAEALPDDHDLHLFSHVLHDWDEPRVRWLLAASFASLPPGGWVVDHDLHINVDKTGPLPAAEYSVFLMHATPGKCWSVAELGEMLADCGFDDVSYRNAGAIDRCYWHASRSNPRWPPTAQPASTTDMSPSARGGDRGGRVDVAGGRTRGLVGVMLSRSWRGTPPLSS